jgi:hypothetical protein
MPSERSRQSPFDLPNGAIMKAIEFLRAPKPVRRSSQTTGLLLAVAWLGYVAYISVTQDLGWPPGDEQLQIAMVAVAIYAAGWLTVRLTFGLFLRLRRRFLPGRSAPSWMQADGFSGKD